MNENLTGRLCNEIVCEHDAVALKGEKKTFLLQPDLTGKRTSLNTPHQVVVRRCCTGQRLVVEYDPDDLAAKLPPYEAQGFDCAAIRADIDTARSLNRRIGSQ